MSTSVSLWPRLGLVGAALLTVALSGCGRSELYQSCQLDEDCPSGWVCQGAVCLDPSRPGADMTRPDMAQPDMIMPPPDMIMPDMIMPAMCRSVEDCPGQGGPVEERNMCVAYACEQSRCVPGDLQVEACSPWQRSSGCSCGPISCRQESQCNGYACVSGTCGPCRTNQNCASGVCGADGRCQEQMGCRVEEDCAANELCGPNGLCVPRPQCVIDRDCGPQEVCLSGKCSYSPECRVDEDCRPGYECVGDRCFEQLCRGPEDCAEGELCDAGKCVVPVIPVERCFVASPPTVTVTPNQRVQLDAFAVDAQGNGVAATFVWTSSRPNVASIAGSEAVARNVAGTTSVTAALASGGRPIQCEGQVQITNLGPTPMNQLRVLVIDAENGAAIPNAEVRVGNTSAQTDATGLATLPDPGANRVYQVSVFSDGYNYLTVQGVRAKDIRLPLNPATGAGPRAGFTGTFDLARVSSTGEFNIGLAGQSIAGGLINFDLTSLLGDPFLSSLNVPGQGSFDLPIPGGLVLYGRVFGLSIRVKERFYANGAGGARLAWGLGGKLPPNQLIQLFMGGAPGSLGEVLALLLPLFNRFDHGLRPLNQIEYPRIVDAMDIDRDGDRTELVPDYQRFPTIQLAPTVRQQLVTSINVSNLPQLPGGPGELAVIVGGALLQAPGFVPLGISATTDQDGDGRPDARLLTMAPPYGALSGARFAIMAISIRTGDLSPTPQGGLELPDEFSAALWNGQSLPTSIQFGTFPDASTGQIQAQRRVSIQSSAGPLYRLRFVGQQRSWDVWSAGPTGAMGSFTHTITVPTPPRGREDLFNTGGVLLDSIRTQVGIDSLVTPAGVLLHDVALVSTSFNRTRLRD